MARCKTIKEKLADGMTFDALVEEGYNKSSIRKAMSDLENGIGIGRPGRKKSELSDDEGIEIKFSDNQHSTDEQYIALANTIIKVAVYDLARCYVASKKTRRRNGFDDINRYAIKILEDWFYEESSNFTNIPPEVLIQAAKERAERGISHNKPIVAERTKRDSYIVKIDHRRKEYRNG